MLLCQTLAHAVDRICGERWGEYEIRLTALQDNIGQTRAEDREVGRSSPVSVGRCVNAALSPTLSTQDQHTSSTGTWSLFLHCPSSHDCRGFMMIYNVWVNMKPLMTSFHKIKGVIITSLRISLVFIKLQLFISHFRWGNILVMTSLTAPVILHSFRWPFIDPVIRITCIVIMAFIEPRDILHLWRRWNIWAKKKRSLTELQIWRQNLSEIISSSLLNKSLSYCLN